MNEYKQAWYANTLVGIQEAPEKKKRVSSKKSGGFGKEFKSHLKQDVKRGAYAVAMGIGMQASKYAARSQLTGALGVSLRVGGRVGLRVIPVVGMALMAYDLYQFGKWASEKI
jgi:hypothetical protein